MKKSLLFILSICFIGGVSSSYKYFMSAFCSSVHILFTPTLFYSFHSNFGNIYKMSCLALPFEGFSPTFFKAVLLTDSR